MKYNERYDRRVSEDGSVYRYSKSLKRLIKCNLSNSCGYLYCHVRCKDNLKLVTHKENMNNPITRKTLAMFVKGGILHKRLEIG